MPTIKTKKGPDQDYTSNGTDAEKDEFGKRRVDPSTKRQIDKAKGTLPDSVGVPAVHGDSEDEAFRKADELIQKLKTSKDTTQYF